MTNHRACEKLILESLVRLRNRKDATDIHKYVSKHGTFTADEVEVCLLRLIGSKDIVRVVDTKGTVTFRKKRQGKIKLLNNNYARKVVRQAITFHVDKTSCNDNRGVTGGEITQWLIENGHDDPGKVRRYIKVVLRRLLKENAILKVEDDCYLATPLQSTNDIKTEKKPEQSVNSTGTSTGSDTHMHKPVGGRGRKKQSPFLTSRRRKPGNKCKKIVGSHGPDTGEMPVKQDAPCDYCLSLTNKLGEEEALIFCKDCNAKAHPSCMKYSEVLASRACNSPWQCIDCKTCYVCEDSGDPDMMLFCDFCDKGYHMKCHNPPISNKPNGKWACGKCVLEGTQTISDEDPPINAEGVKQTQTQSSTNVAVSTTPPKLRVLTEIPDASDWGVSQVAAFFKSLGFVNECQCFIDQEIDGKSLLLLKRDDVLTGLSLKLGPALKIYFYIKRLQTHTEIL